jgi:hypothetical protein
LNYTLSRPCVEKYGESSNGAPGEKVKKKRLAWYITKSRFGIKFQGLVVVNGELKGP